MLSYLKKKKIKIGILGGSFNPAHNGHLGISKIAKRKFNLKYIIWTITEKNPFKVKYKVPVYSRIKFAKKITKSTKYIKVEFLEKTIKSKRTIKLLKFIKKKNPSIEIFFIMGADNLINFHKWYKWKEISKISNILVFDRKNYTSKSLKSNAIKYIMKKKLRFIKFKKINISSSKIRNN